MVAELLDRGANAVCLVRDQVSQSHFQRLGLDRRAVIVRGSLEDYPLLERALNEHEIDTVLHLGAQTIVGTASRNPMSTWEANVRGSYNLLEACRHNAKKVQRVVVSVGVTSQARRSWSPSASVTGPWLPYIATSIMAVTANRPFVVRRMLASS